MRTRTFILSFLVHTAVIGAAIAVRIFAPTALPDPPRSTSYMLVAAEAPPDVQLPATAAAMTPEAMPIDEHDSIAVDASDFPNLAPSDGVTAGGLGQFTGEILGVGPPAPPGLQTDPLPPQRVGGLIRPAQKIHHVSPVYPELARDSRITGTVILEALIAEDGSVREVKVLKSVPLLDTSALDAVRQWRFMPTLLNGVPVQIIMSVTVTFTLK